MKKFSTAVLPFALALMLLPPAGAAEPPKAEAGKAATDGVPTVKASPKSRSCEFRSDAPDQHVVVRGDTLWAISIKFLDNAWCWPQVWGMNKDQIKSPHWIYPGQVVYFDRVAGKLRLGTPTGTAADGVGGGDIKLLPQARVQALGRAAVPSIPSGLIEPFLSQPLIVAEKELLNTPRIVALPEERVAAGKDDRVYVMGDLEGATSFQAFRPAVALKDPVTKAILGYEAVFLGTLKLVKDGEDKNEAHSMRVIASKEELVVGDRLIPVKPTPMINYVPHPPAGEVEAKVIAVYGGVTHAGQFQIVSINRGEGDVDIGTVLELYRTGTIVRDRTDTKNTIRIPDERYGSMFIFRVFDSVSYGLIMQVTEPVRIGDTAKSPD